VSVARPDWARRAFAACAQWFDAVPPALSGRLSRVRARTARGQGGSSVESALTAPFATPFIALTEAYRTDLELPDGDALCAVGEGTLGLYFYLRIQDDVVDEPGTFDPSYVYAAEVLAGASAEAFARAVGARPAFWGFRRVTLTELAAVSAWELDTYRGFDRETAGAHAEEHAAMLGSKLVPTAIPLAALAAIAGQERAFAWIGPCARALGRALQIANDLLNARDDHAARRLTPSLAALYAGGRVAPEGEAFRVWPALAGDPALPRMLVAATGHAEAAASLAREQGAGALAAQIGETAGLLREVPERLLKLAMGVSP
jgi:hypothetical protein